MSQRRPLPDLALREWATSVQARYIEAIHEHGTVEAAARALGVNPKTVRVSIAGVEKKAAVKGWSPTHDMTKAVPEGFSVKGVSSYYGQDEATGALKLKGQWVKSRAEDEERERIVLAAFEAMASELPRVLPIPAPAETREQLCNLYTMTDCHVGMLAWHREGGADWDLKIAERVLTGCFSQMIASSPPARTCVINQLGDWLHFDGMDAKTPMSGHLLDADGRFQKVVVAALRVLRAMVDMALARHRHVTVVIAEGNHDIASSVWLRVMFGALYENDPRITINDSALPYYLHQHGQTMLGFTHGHLARGPALPLLFAAQFPIEWGTTTKRYIHTGHLHHEALKEHPGAKVVQHPTLAARDAYAARGGWISERQATAYTYHSRHGQVASFTVTPEMLEDPAPERKTQWPIAA